MSVRIPVIVIVVIAGALACGACAPSYHRVHLPGSGPYAAASWAPARLGGEAEVTDLSGVHWAGTVVALGDSIVIRVDDRPVEGRRAFAPDQIASLQYRPLVAGGERAVSALFFIVLGAAVLVALTLAQLPFS